jgi:Mg2+ and Co2+ transporter CorA
VFFEKELQGRSQPPPSRTDEESLVQPLSALATSYGRSLNWEFARQRPIQVIEEFFNFSAAASAQYIDMLDKHISEALGKVKLAESDSTGLDLISTFDDAQNSLVRYAAHFQETIQWVRKASSSTAWLGILGTIPPTVNVPAHIPMEEDLQFLTEKARTLVSLCESGKSTLLSNTSIEESRRSNEEARLVNNLSKATTRLTFIFLPISYVTSIFGMNFRQFGQGEQDISLWFMITIPLLFFCVAAVEFGPFFWRKLRAMGRSILNAILG